MKALKKILCVVIPVIIVGLSVFGVIASGVFNKYTFTVDTEADNVLSVDIDTNGVSEGKVVSALYDKRMRLRNVKISDCAPKLNVTFDGVHSGDKLKVCWWDGADTLMPIGNAE